MYTIPQIFEKNDRPVAYRRESMHPLFSNFDHSYLVAYQPSFFPG